MASMLMKFVYGRICSDGDGDGVDDDHNGDERQHDPLGLMAAMMGDDVRRCWRRCVDSSGYGIDDDDDR
eukprot:scaffold8536_cov36-Cyclotella_meneghiniana.AAC.6